MYSLNSDMEIRHFDTVSGSVPPEDEKYFSTKQELAAIATSKQTVTAIFNGLAGAPPFGDLKPLKQVKSVGEGLTRVWNAIQRLDPAYVPPAAIETAEPPCEHGVPENVPCDECALAMNRTELSGVEPEPEWKEGEENEVGKKKAGMNPLNAARKKATARAKKPAKAPKPAKVAKAKGERKKRVAAPKAAKTGKKREGGKRDIVMGLLGRKNGASTEDLMKATGWLSHSVRGYLSTLRSKHGVKVVTKKDPKRGCIYSVAA